MRHDYSMTSVWCCFFSGHYWDEAQPEGLSSTLVWKLVEARNVRNENGNAVTYTVKSLYNTMFGVHRNRLC